MAYIANKPVRFDKDYKVGDGIPDNVVDSNAEKRLISWGKITKIPVGTSANSENIAAKSAKNKKSAKE